MKNRINCIAVILSLFLILTTNSYAQEGTFHLGGGLVYGTGALEDGINDDLQNDFGIDVNAYYAITGKIRVGGGFNYFFPKKIERSSGNVNAELKYTVSGLYIDGQYLFYNDSSLNAYGMIGFTFINLDKEGTVSSGGNSASDTESESKTSLNLGGGVEFKQDFGNIFIELRYDFQAVLSSGVRFSI